MTRTGEAAADKRLPRPFRWRLLCSAAKKVRDISLDFTCIRSMCGGGGQTD
jgi:hypothetical protein